MDLNTVKKEILKQKPTAFLGYIRKGNAYYKAEIEGEKNKYVKVLFEVPVTDMGDADFTPMMEAKLMNRWILNTDQDA